MRILITGAGGFLGRGLTKHLRQLGYDVVPTDITVENRLDVRKLSDFKSVFNTNPTDAVVHLAALVGSPPSKKEPYKFLKVNLYGAMNLLEAMRLHSVKKLVYVSSFDVYDFQKVDLPVDEETPVYPESPYGASKICGETLVKLYSDLYGIKSVILRLCGPLYGPSQGEGTIIKKIVDHMVSREPFEVWGNVTRCFLHIDDAVNACVKTLEYLEGMEEPWQLFLTSTEPVSTHELVETAKSISDFDTVYKKPPKHIANRMVDQKGVGMKLRQYTGWRQQKSIREGLKECYEVVAVEDSDG